ncbi:MAG TPA: NADH-quinone oxidoreductase subunit NuoG [Bryobacteraceae bacterium]
MATVYIDNRPYPMDENQNLLHACLSAGLNLPYFCWHPALGSVGACRQCAVKQFKDESDKRGKIVMACMTPAKEGTRISIDDPEVVEFRRAIIEGLMLNHPHDCPVCDEGGECHLQDMTVMTGHDYRRASVEKRTFRNQYLGPFVHHEMNRCIQCYRCVRFYREYAGASDLNSFALRDTVYFGREREGVLESEFAGNLVEVCPTGVFTDATLRRHYTRKWDLQFAPSLCVHCGLGCNISVAERYGSIRRTVNRYNGAVNGYFLCDRGRFGYEFTNRSDRIRQARLRSKPVPADAAIGYLRLLASSGAIGIGSPRASLESNYALRELVGPEHFFAGLAGSETGVVKLMLEVLRSGAARTPSLREIEEADAVFILGEDISNTGPRMALSVLQSIRQQPMEIAEKLKIPLWLDHAVREAVQDARGPLFIATPYATRLDGVATRVFRGAPDDLARLGFAVARAIDPSAPDPEVGHASARQPARGPSEPRPQGAVLDAAQEIAEALQSAHRPVVIAGASLRSAALIRAAANIARARPGCALAFVAPESNSMGLALMGAPALDAAFESHAETLIVLENDLYRRAPEPVIEEFLSRFRHIVVLDSLENATTAHAELLLPAASFAEGDGTFVSSEGRAQRAYQAFVPEEPICESWRWLGDWHGLDDAIAAVAAAFPALFAITAAAPPASFRPTGNKIPREPHRYSGRTAKLANIAVSEPMPPPDPDSPLNFSMEGYSGQPPSPLIPFFWSPGWNSYQAVNKFQEEIAGPLRGGDAGVRLIEPSRQAATYYADIPSAFAPHPGEWLIVPIFHVFGSEELSCHAPGVAELAPQPYVALNPADAAQFGQQVECLGQRVPVKLAPDLPVGTAGVPAGIPPFCGLDLPLRAAIGKTT